MADNKEAKGLITPAQGEFLHNYMLESVHNADHDGVVRIFVGVSCKLGDFFNYSILHYAEQFFLLPGV